MLQTLRARVLTAEAWPVAQPSARPADRWLIAILAVGVLLRASTLVFLPNLVWPDETFQYVEQAQRLLGGPALVPWEFQIGARSWILPLVVLPAVALGRLVSHSPEVVYGFVAAEMIAIAAAGAVAAYKIGVAVGSRLHGLFSALLVTVWCEAVWISTHPLADAIGASLLLISLAACLTADTPRKLVGAGVWLGLTAVVRMQLAPVLALFALLPIWRAPIRNGAPLLLGGCAVVLLAGLLDWPTWGAPFHSFRIYLQANRGGVASSFGEEDWLYYLVLAGLTWRWAGLAVVATALIGGRRLPVALIGAVIIFVVFSMVGHKEYRFVYPAIALAMVLCGLGTADLAKRLSDAPNPVPRSLAAGGLVAIWLALSAYAATSPLMALNWTRERTTLAAMTTINRDPAACGVAIAPTRAWVWTGASRLRDDLTLYHYTAAGAGAFNYYLVFDDAPPPPATFKAVTCDPQRFCLYRRPGGCAGAGAPLDAPPPPKTAAALRQMGLM